MGTHFFGRITFQTPLKSRWDFLNFNVRDMPGHLSRKRRFGTGPAWTSGLDSFLNTPATLDHIDRPPLDASEHDSSPRPAEGPPRFRYDINKRAFDTAQRRRSRAFQKYQTTMERVDNLQRKARRATIIKPPTKQSQTPVRDCHVVEYVVATRNDQYTEASRLVPKGVVPDLNSFHRLPREIGQRSDGSPRVYYWGGARRGSSAFG
jgi:hypothetical protein